MRAREVLHRPSLPLLAAVTVVGLFTIAPHSALADDCPTPIAGHWVGDWDSTALDAGGGIDQQVSFNGDAVSGTVALTGSSFAGGDIIGRVECGRFTMGFVVGVSRFTGTLSGDGRSASGTYIAPTVNDTGTWSAKFVGDAPAAGGGQGASNAGQPATSPTTAPPEVPKSVCPAPPYPDDLGAKIEQSPGSPVAGVEVEATPAVGVEQPLGTGSVDPCVGWCGTRDDTITEVAP